MEAINNIDYLGLMISYNESQTVGNCIDLGFGSEKIKSIISLMRLVNADYLSKKDLEQYR